MFFDFDTVISFLQIVGLLVLFVSIPIATLRLIFYIHEPKIIKTSSPKTIYENDQDIELAFLGTTIPIVASKFKNSEMVKWKNNQPNPIKKVTVIAKTDNKTVQKTYNVKPEDIIQPQGVYSARLIKAEIYKETVKYHEFFFMTEIEDEHYIRMTFENTAEHQKLNQFLEP